MDAVIVQLTIDEDPGSLLLLADEVAEDPRCSEARVGMDDEGAILVTIWDPDTVVEVEQGFRAVYGDKVRRIQLVDPRLG